MTTSFSETTPVSGSAKIYTFPPRGRFAASGQRQDVAPVANAPLTAVKIVSGSGWYHEDAIQTEQRRKS